MQEHEVISNGATVWVNSASGMCVGRFSRHGVDVHNDYQAQLDGKGECLDCCHDLQPVESWERFVSSMEEHHGIKVDESHRPAFVKATREAKGEIFVVMDASGVRWL